ncbi:MAG: S1C family serine protease, partial [Acidimicrobiales bacterium]
GQGGAPNVPDVIAIAETVQPAIVRIDIQGADGLSSGSGVIFRSDGYILTNAHVVKDADKVFIDTQDGETYEADIVGADPRTDIAVVKVDMQDAPVALLGSAENLQVGQWAITIGSPLGLAGGNTVTLGVVSALERELRTNGSQNILYDLIQTDALIAPGSSGGALLDGNGSVIGITTAIAVSDVGADGVGFAVPIDIASRVANELIETGEVRHAWIGITGGDPSDATLTEVGIPGGVEIQSIVEDGPASELAIGPMDIIIAIDGMEVQSMTGLILRLRDLSSGDVVDLQYITPSGSKVTESIELGTRPDAEELDQLTELPTTTVPDTTTTG